MLNTLRKLKSKFINCFDMKPDIVNLGDEKCGDSLELIGMEEEFLKRPAIVNTVRPKT